MTIKCTLQLEGYFLKANLNSNFNQRAAKNDAGLTEEQQQAVHGRHCCFRPSNHYVVGCGLAPVRSLSRQYGTT